MAGGGHTLAVQPHKPRCGQRGGIAAGAHHARVPKPFVDALAIPTLGTRSQDGSLAPCSSCCLSAASFAKGEFGIRLFVAAVRSMWLRKILLALRAIDHVHLVAARPFATCGRDRFVRRVRPDAPSAVAVHAGPAVAGGPGDRGRDVDGARPARRLSGIRSGRCIGTFGRQGRGRRGGSRIPRLAFAANVRRRGRCWSPFGSTSRPPNLDEGRFLGRLAFNRTRLAASSSSAAQWPRLRRTRLRPCNLFRLRARSCTSGAASGATSFRLRQQ